MIPEKLLINESFTSHAVAFNRPLPTAAPFFTQIDPSTATLGHGAVVGPDGSVAVSIYAPAADQVAVWMDGMDAANQLQLDKQADGVWTGTLPFISPGFKWLCFFVDGAHMIHPAAPVGYGWRRIMNFVDIPDPEATFYLLRDVPHGSVARETYFSTTTGQFESCLVYTPPQYAKDHENEHYPVLYLQHGSGENETVWTFHGKVNLIMDNLLAAGKATPCIIVMNNGMVQLLDDDGKCQVDPAAFESLLIHDCIPFINQKYRVRTDKNSCALAGLSMGSMQACSIAFKHSDLFDWIGLFSGFMRNRFITQEQNTHLQLLDDAAAFGQTFKLFFRAIGTDDTLIRIFLEDDQICLDKRVSPEQCPIHIRRLYAQGHEWQVWRHCAHDFLQLIFR